jgi:hypothetical protein
MVFSAGELLDMVMSNVRVRTGRNLRMRLYLAIEA